MKMAGLSVKTAFGAAFAALILLSLDIWNWALGGPDVVGMPYWVVWDIAMVIATGIFYLLLSLYVWRDD
jgi:hypothetical protein